MQSPRPSLSEQERSILAAQPIKMRRGVRGWVYLRNRVRAEEYAALRGLAEALETYPAAGRHPYQVRIGTLIRSIANGFFGLIDMKTGRTISAPRRQIVGKIRHRRSISRPNPADWPETLNTED